MGLMKILSSSSYDRGSQPCIATPPAFPNPNPANFKILQVTEGKHSLVVEVLYPDCTNYEGRKILLYTDVTLVQLVNQKTIDPHFSDNAEFHSPVARFEPTKRGWQMAMWLSKRMDNGK